MCIMSVCLDFNDLWEEEADPVLKHMKYCVCPSPLEKTVVLGVTSRSRDGLKGKAHSCDSLARSVRSSSRSRKGRTDLWSPMFNTQTWSKISLRCNLSNTQNVWEMCIFRPSSNRRWLFDYPSVENTLWEEKEKKHVCKREINQRETLLSWGGTGVQRDQLKTKRSLQNKHTSTWGGKHWMEWIRSFT